MKAPQVIIGVISFTVGCSVLGQSAAEKPVGTHYSAAFLKGSRLVVFPFNGNEVAVELPVAVGPFVFSANKPVIYGMLTSQPDATADFVTVSIKPGGVSHLPGLNRFSYINDLAVDAAGKKAIISAMYGLEAARRCGLFELDLTTGRVEHIIDNVSGQCDYLSSWGELSLSPDGSRAVGRAQKGQLGVVNLKEHRIERLWSGSAASWSPDGKWIATLTLMTRRTKLELIDAHDFSKQRDLGAHNGGLQWSPDSRYLLVWESEWACGMGVGYIGTLKALDIENGRRLPIKSSKCRVDAASTGWISDAVMK